MIKDPFLKFPSMYDKSVSVYLKPEAVIALEPSGDNVTAVHLGGGQYVSVLQDVESVKAAIFEALGVSE